MIIMIYDRIILEIFIILYLFRKIVRELIFYEENIRVIIDSWW